MADELLRPFDEGAVPEDRDEWTAEHRALWLLAHLLEWHWREEKVSYWEYFRLAELDAAELLDEKYGVSGLRFEAAVGGKPRWPIHRYSSRCRSSASEVGDSLHAGEVRLGRVWAVDLPARRLDVKKTEAARDLHPEAVFAHDHFRAGAQAAAMLRLGRWVAAHGVDSAGPYRAARDLLLGLPPASRPARSASCGSRGRRRSSMPSGWRPSSTAAPCRSRGRRARGRRSRGRG